MFLFTMFYMYFDDLFADANDHRHHLAAASARHHKQRRSDASHASSVASSTVKIAPAPSTSSRSSSCRGEREPRSYSIAWGVRDGEWAPKQRLARRRKCFGCQKSLDVSSVIVLDRAWHRKCLTCSGCRKPLSGNRYYMFDNRVYDQACFQKAREAPALQPSHTSIVDYRYPAPVSPADHRSPGAATTAVTSSSAASSPASESSVGTPAFRGSAVGASSSTTHAGHDGDDLGKMSHEMKKRLANDLLNALMSLRTRERRPQTASPESSIISASSETLNASEQPAAGYEMPSVASRRRMFEKKASKSSSSSKDESE